MEIIGQAMQVHDKGKKTRWQKPKPVAAEAATIVPTANESPETLRQQPSHSPRVTVEEIDDVDAPRPRSNHILSPNVCQTAANTVYPIISTLD